MAFGYQGHLKLIFSNTLVYQVAFFGGSFSKLTPSANLHDRHEFVSVHTPEKMKAATMWSYLRGYSVCLV